MNSLRTALLASRVFEPEAGAAAYRLGALVRALEIAGVRTTVLTTQPRVPVRSTKSVRRWPVARDRHGGSRGYLKYATFDIPLFFRLLCAARVDVMIVEPPPSTGFVTRLVSALRGIPYVYFAADISSRAAAGVGVNAFVVRVVRAIERFALRGAHTVLSVSPGVTQELIALGVEPGRIVLVGTGIDTARFPLHGAAAEPGYPYFVYAGTMSEIQGAGVFIDAFESVAQRHPQIRLHLFGQGVELAALMERADLVGDGRISFGGVIPSDQLAPWLRGSIASLASVRPSTGYDFAFATKALAGLSCGAPVIFAGVGPLRALVIGHLLGWQAEWTSTDVAAAMERALATPISRMERERLSSWVSRHHSIDAVTAVAVASITDCIDAHRVERVDNAAPARRTAASA
ncbi:MAG: glycosyltransferase [Microbacteriaceae bacterium]